jgi:hypothetical protein
MADEQVSENAEGKVPVTVSTSTGEEVTIHVPEDCTDPVVRFEDPHGVKGEWVNPNAPAPATADDDVIWDAASQSWIPRVTVADGGTAVDVSG